MEQYRGAPEVTRKRLWLETVQQVLGNNRTIVGVDCNRAVAFAPHAQHNADVHVRAVIARGCSQGVIESEDERLGHAKRGTFDNSTVSAVAVIAGADAQNPRQAGGSEGAWRTGESLQAFARDKSASWEVSYSDVYCAGTFERAPDRIMLGGSRQVPRCV